MLLANGVILALNENLWKILGLYLLISLSNATCAPLSAATTDTTPDPGVCCSQTHNYIGQYYLDMYEYVKRVNAIYFL